ncbi:MerR family transcriptional regulator [Enterococcus casseliflavus]|nr:MerR family transcriptional regulator [Enterococcus casseliflavus]
MKKQLTISEMSAYAGVSRRTLIYYDQIDLFKPHSIGDNGYRYYGFEQCLELDVILMLRSLDMPLQDIRQFLKNRNPEYTQKELVERRGEVRDKIAALQELERTFDRYIQRYEKVQEADFETFTIAHHKAEAFIVSEEIAGDDPESAYQVYARFYPLVDYKDAFSGYPIGFLSAGTTLEDQTFHASPYRALILIPQDRLHLYPEKLIITRPAGTYVSGFVSEGEEQIAAFTHRIRAFLKEKQLKIDGDVWELLWQDEVFTTQKDLQIFEVMVPVKPK